MIFEIFFTIAGIFIGFELTLAITDMIRYPVNSVWKAKISVQTENGVRSMNVEGIIMKRMGNNVLMWVKQIGGPRIVKMDDLNKIWIRVEE